MDHPENSSEYAGLQVNSGVEQPSIINPYLKRNRVRRRELSVGELVEGILKGDVTILSQAVTLIESVNPDHQARAQEVINKCLPYSGHSVRVGISGVPGAGKSTSIDEFGIHVLKEKGGRLAVLAIDPSSERTKGSILGDKTRMEKLAQHPDSFIRPSPSAGSLGGVARKTRETIILCEAAGFDKIFVETVGVGQSETACHSMVDFFLLIQVAGTGDELQGIKRGDGCHQFPQCPSLLPHARERLDTKGALLLRLLRYGRERDLGHDLPVHRFREGQRLLRLPSQRTVEILDVRVHQRASAFELLQQSCHPCPAHSR